MSEITDVDAWEVLDSRGDPTVRVSVTTRTSRGTFTVPSGASTGSHEAVEVRDGGDRYGGNGVRRAVRAVRDELAPLVIGREVTDQSGIDAAMVEHDGTDSLSRLGANAILGVSGAVLHAASNNRGVSIYELVVSGDPGALPMPMVNVISGGLHAHGGIEIQDLLVIPVGATTYSEAIETVWDVRTAVRDRILQSGHRPLVADEGGFSPPLSTIDDAFELLERGVRDTGRRPGADVAFAVDVAASHFYWDGGYHLESEDRTLDRDGMIDLVTGWTEQYPVRSIEDPLDEDDWQGWSDLVAELDDDIQVVGDDLLATNADRLRRGLEMDATTAALVKPNQAGTVSRTIEFVRTA